MKTHILKLETHDDLVSTLDKMGWGKSERIILVWPKKARILRRRLDLVLVQRRSSSLGAQVALVTRDPQVRYYAFRTGIPVFSTLKQAQSKPWQGPRFNKSAQDREVDNLLESYERINDDNWIKKDFLHSQRPQSWLSVESNFLRLAIFFTAVISFLFLSAVLFPRAEIVLEPKIESQEITWVIKPKLELDEVSLSGEIPAREISVIVEGRDALAASGNILYPEQIASGSATFTNLTETSVLVGKGTIVRSSDNQRFTVTSQGILPAGIGEKISLPVSSQQAGKQGNIPANSLISIEGALGSQASVTNPLPLKNGSDQSLPAPTSTDRHLLAAKLYKTLEASAVHDIEKKLSQGDLLIPGTLSEPSVVSEIFTPAEYTPANEISLSLRLEFSALYIPATDIRKLANSALDANLPQGFLPVNNSPFTSISEASQPDDMQDSTYTVTFQRKITTQIRESAVIQNVIGKSVERAQSDLLNILPLANKPVIRMIPGWWPRLPVIPFRIQVKIENNFGEVKADD